MDRLTSLIGVLTTSHKTKWTKIEWRLKPPNRFFVILPRAEARGYSENKTDDRIVIIN
jgi:hypothetical protein